MGERYRRLLDSYQPRPEIYAVPERSLRRLTGPEAQALLATARRLFELDDDLERPDSIVERRGSFRRPYPQALLMTPCALGNSPRLDETRVVVAKDLSRSGVGFIHTRAVRDPYALLTMRTEGTRPLCLLSLVKRSTAIRRGLYLVGVEFVERVALADDIEPTEGP